MNEFAVLAAVAALVMLFLLIEVASAVLPLIIVLTLVPPGERQELANLIAACDSSHKLRIWPALRLAVEARRRQREQANRDDSNLNRHRDLDATFAEGRGREPAVNPRYGGETDRLQSPAENQPADPTAT
jgi:hypothetical protein